MLVVRVGVVSLILTIAQAFQDTSPFFLFSTSELLADSPDLIYAQQLKQKFLPELSSCLSDSYIIVSQPGVNAADYGSRHSAPHLRKKMLGGDKSIRSSLAVRDVLGDLDSDDISQTVQQKCGAGHLRVDASTGSFAVAEDSKPRVINVDFPSLPAGAGRSQRLLENDAFLASMLDLLPSNKYTVVYITSPSNAAYHSNSADSEPYEMDSLFQTTVHTELRRDLDLEKRASDGNITLVDGPLFERYQYLTPGLFMGLLVFLLLISILYVGISGVASLQVSYAAFDKEMGPAAQKKQS